MTECCSGGILLESGLTCVLLQIVAQRHIVSRVRIDLKRRNFKTRLTENSRVRALLHYGLMTSQLWNLGPGVGVFSSLFMRRQFGTFIPRRSA